MASPGMPGILLPSSLRSELERLRQREQTADKRSNMLVIAALRNLDLGRQECAKLHMNYLFEVTPVYLATPRGSNRFVRLRPENGEHNDISSGFIWEWIKTGQEGGLPGFYVIVRLPDDTRLEFTADRIGFFVAHERDTYGTGLAPTEIHLAPLPGGSFTVGDILYDPAETNASKVIGYPILPPMPTSEVPTYVALPASAPGNQLPGVLLHNLGRESIVKRVAEMSADFVVAETVRQDMTKAMKAKELFTIEAMITDYVRCLEDYVALDVFKRWTQAFLATTRRGLYRMGIMLNARLVNARALLSGTTREPRLSLDVLYAAKEKTPGQADVWIRLSHPVEVTENCWFEPLDKTAPIPYQLWYYRPPAPL